MRVTSLHIRLANSDDLERMIAVINAAFAIETFLEGTRTDSDRIAALMRKGKFLVGEEANEIVACVYVELRGRRGYFGMLAVDPARQGSGWGRALVQAAEDYCRRRCCTAMDIDVLSLRTELPPFYEKLGYRQSGIEAFHPSRPLRPGIECHCVVMSKPL